MKEVSAGEGGHNIAAAVQSVLPEEISQKTGAPGRLDRFRPAERQRKVEVFDRFPSRQPATKTDGLKGCLPDIESDTIGDHLTSIDEESGWFLPFESLILHGNPRICDRSDDFERERRSRREGRDG